MAEDTKRYFKIRCKVTGLYSKGWSYCSPVYKGRKRDLDRNGFSINGKIWTGTGPLRNHLNEVMSGARGGVNIDDFEIIEYELKEKVTGSIVDYVDVMKILRKK